MVFRLGIFGILVAALAAVLYFAFSVMHAPRQAAQQAVPPPVTEQVLVAAGALSAGALLQPGNIASAAVAVGAAPDGALADNPQNRAELAGAMVRVSLSQGAALTDGEVIHPGDHGFLAAVLAPGMRAVTVAVDNVTGADGLIWPGDSVDVLLTQSISGAPDGKSIAAEVVLSGVRVIATGTELIKDTSDGPNGGQPASTVTLEVTPEQASRCLVAINLGKLSLIVHSSQTEKDMPQPPPPLPVWAGDVSPALAAGQPVAPQVTTVNVIAPGGSGEFKF